MPRRPGRHAFRRRPAGPCRGAVSSPVPASGAPAQGRGVSGLYRADRVRDATLADAPVCRRDGVEPGDVWELLRRKVEPRPADIEVTARVRVSRLDMFLRIHAAQLTDGETVVEASGEWARVALVFTELRAVRALLAFGEHVEVLSPPEARDTLAGAAAAVTELYGGSRPAPG
ncbi:WYL domain-containing protein [Streptomyces sp. PSRA5]|uniref:helix-turn-helix transcriptional regulator n=1 Tax=Streptomyces panacea TaxID=3035064 RepID=UPI00339C9F24